MASSPVLKALGAAIRRERQTKNLSIEAVARNAGMSPEHLDRIERGHDSLRATTLHALASALEMTIPALLRSNPSVEAMLAPHGERRLTPEHFGQLPTDGEG